MNRIILAGRLTRDPEVGNVGTDNVYARFSLAVDRGSKNAAGERTADFFNCIAFRYTADYLSKYVRKGNMIILEGKIQQSKFEKDGITRVTYDVIVDNVQNVEPRSTSGGGYVETPIEQLRPTFQNQQQSSIDEEDEFAKDSLSFSVSDDDLPF